jgi:predicted NUDIX family NTP pyrophosphohydrolase
MNTKNFYCANCGRQGHRFKKCRDPITSLGIIDFKFCNNKIRLKDKIKHNNWKYDLKKKNTEFIDDIKFLLICRRNTICYVEFIRGKYNINNTDYILELFNNMTILEIENIKCKNFNKLWQDLWLLSDLNSDNYNKEYNLSLIKFNKLNDTILDNIINKSNCIYTTPEWEFPKGRRNIKEKNIECAVREFKEETDLNITDYNIICKNNPIYEIYTGRNNIKYKHIYFIGQSNSNITLKINPSNILQISETSNIGWFTFNEASKIIRNYNSEKKIILEKILFYILNNININLDNY